MFTSRIAGPVAVALAVGLAGCGDGAVGGSGGGCTSAQDCDPGQTCDPTSHECTNQAECTTHGECGNAAYCDGTGSCQPNFPGGPCDTSNDCVSGETCGANGCVPSSGDIDAGCGGALFTAQRVPPNVLIVLDRTGSMNQDIPGGSKWDIARAALYTMLDNFGSEIFFGLMLFPGTQLDCESGQRCTIPGAVVQDPARGTAGTIGGMLMNDVTTCGLGTPIASSLDTLPNYMGLEDTSRSNYVVLVTDGMEECNGDPVASVTALYNETPQIKTFVIGFGGGVDATQLNDMAVAGGTARPTAPFYYQAGNAAELDLALATIAGSVLSCSYVLTEVPPNGDELYVFFDRVEVPRDPTHANGWDYDAASNQINFYGDACAELQSGGVTDLQIVFGCPDIIVN